MASPRVLADRRRFPAPGQMRRARVGARRLALSLVCLLGLTACSAVGPRAQRSAAGAGTEIAQAQASRTLVLVLRAEPVSLAGTQLYRLGITTGTQRRLFNAGLMVMDADGNPLPYLAESFPQLDTDSWRVFPDGRMETTYRLKPRLAWHDGVPLSSEDFAFAWRVYSNPDLGISGSPPHAYMEHVLAPDERTLMIQWSRPFPGADFLEGFGRGATDHRLFTALPRHVLERVYEEQAEAFLHLPFWTTEYIGLGPYRVERWEPGAFVQTVAFDYHALGRPKIEHLKLIFNPDANSALAALLAGEAHVPADDSIRVQQGVILKREWASRNGGAVQYVPSLWRSIHVQHRPEYANSRAILDPRVRAALAHTMDKQAISDSIFEGQAILGDVPIPPTEPYFSAIDRAAVKYPLDGERAARLMEQAGYARRADGFYSSGEGRVNFELQVIASPQNEAERAVLADGWRRAGFEVEEAVITAAQTQDRQIFAVFRSLSTTSGALGPSAMNYFTSASIARPETRWIGQNRGGWSAPAYDRFFDAYQTTLDRTERVQHLAQAAKILTEQLAMLPLYFNPGVVATPSALRGVRTQVAFVELTWNIHQWELS